MTERTTWTTPKIVAAVIAGVSVLLLMTNLHAWFATQFEVREAVADGWFTLILSTLVVACSVVLWREVSSLRITVVLLALGLFLVFAGTLAQTRLDIWTVIDEWFRGRVVHINFELFVNFFDKATHQKPLDPDNTFPFPGGFLILGLLSINMVAAMAKKIASDLNSSASGVLLRRHAGIYILHVGLLVMFAGEFVTGLYAQEGRLAIEVGSWSDFVEDHIETELAFVDRSDPNQDRHVVIPQALLERHAVIGGDGAVISSDDLPFDVRVEQFMPNAKYTIAEGAGSMRGLGGRIVATPIPLWPGTETQETNIPAVYVTLLDKNDGRVLGTWLSAALPEILRLRSDVKPFIEQPDLAVRLGISDLRLPAPLSSPQAVTPDQPGVVLRYARRYLPYRVYLDKVAHDTYDGTTIPVNFSSTVRVTDRKGELIRPSYIWMNHPMRFDDKAFYQQQMFAGDGLTGLQVVNNPGIWLPYVSCGIVTLGLLVQFGVSLLRYTRRTVR